MFRFAPIAVALTSLAAFAGPTVTQVKDLHFLAKGLAGLKIVGQTTKLEARADGESLVLVVPLDSVDTGIALRNEHMTQKYLDTKTHPNAELKVPLAALKEGKNQAVKGTFTLRDKSKEVDVLTSVIKNGDALDVSGVFDINLKNHDIDIPNYLGVTVKPDVQVSAAFTLKP
ncbi:MAG: hypothetical protein DI536_27005 [Archangium gephyra]|uniref:Lipid/polyisoprenoid-binding YceI-like domain-containing protein n=1 Tax=Archangium gephyra TaxID=48 RepID=A0A2W5T7Q0_9BACT|nr:MAG: hypothetical protein DI536_27005 [Archangium gephyra]